MIETWPQVATERPGVVRPSPGALGIISKLGCCETGDRKPACQDVAHDVIVREKPVARDAAS